MSAGIAIGAHWDARQVQAALSALAPRQWAFATALALTRVGQRVKAAETVGMERALDRPTPYTLRSLYLQGATRQRQEARVWFKDFAPKGTTAGQYLLPEVHGGERRDKRFERNLHYAGLLPSGASLVPASGARLDAYGNVSRGLYTRILADLHASPVGANATRRSVRRRERKGKRGGRYFYGDPGGRGRGVWERFGFAFGSAVRPMFLESRTPRYRPRFAFFGIAEEAVGGNYATEFERAAQETVRTAR